jgi:hypothetical protein
MKINRLLLFFLAAIIIFGNLSGQYSKAKRDLGLFLA